MSHIIWVSTLIIDEDRVLLVHEKKEANYGKINFPGGHLELGETVIEGVKREAREEIQSEIELDGLLMIYSGNKTTPGSEKSTQHFIFLGHIVSGEGRANPAEILDAGWYTIAEISAMEDNLFLNSQKIREALKRYQNGSIVPVETIIEVGK